MRLLRFEQSIRPKTHLAVLEPLLAREKNAPLRLSGDGQQHIYLTSISETLARVLLGLAGPGSQIFTAMVFQDPNDTPVERQLGGKEEWEDLATVTNGISSATTGKRSFSGCRSRARADRMPV